MLSNQSKIASLDELYKFFGSTWCIDMLNVYCILPICIAGVISNLIVYTILRKEKFQNILIFKFIRANIIYSIFISLILSFSFLGTYRVFKFTNSYGSYFFSAYFYTYFLSLFYFNSNLIDIFAVIERITNFDTNSHLKKFICFKYLRLVAFIVMLVINIPNLFVSYPAYRDFELNDGSMFRIYYWHPTDFQNSLTGTILIYSMHFIRDIITLIVKIALNIVSIRIIRKYFDRIGLHPVLNTIIVDKNLTLFSVIMCFFSSIENLFCIVSYVYIYFRYDEITFYLFFLSHLSLAIKQCLNIIVLYKFNSQFRVEIKVYFLLLRRIIFN